MDHFSTSKDVHAYEAGAVLQLFNTALVVITLVAVKIAASDWRSVFYVKLITLVPVGTYVILHEMSDSLP